MYLCWLCAHAREHKDRVMKQFWKVLKRFAAPYKKYLAGSVILNLLSAVFNIFSFALLIPILNILFKMDTTVYEFTPWNGLQNS